MKRLTRYLLNGLIVSYLGVIYFSGVPESNTLNSRLKSKASQIAMTIGIWPSWSMFAPNPIKFDSKSYVEVTHKDGAVQEYDVEVPLKGPLATFRKARWMKYAQDNLRSPTQKGLLPPAIRHFVYKYNDEKNPIVNVKIKRRWEEVHPFNHVKLHSITKTPRTKGNEILLTETLER